MFAVGKVETSIAMEVDRDSKLAEDENPGGMVLSHRLHHRAVRIPMILSEEVSTTVAASHPTVHLD
jgi:hypothetical protein